MSYWWKQPYFSLLPWPCRLFAPNFDRYGTWEDESAFIIAKHSWISNWKSSCHRSVEKTLRELNSSHGDTFEKHWNASLLPTESPLKRTSKPARNKLLHNKGKDRNMGGYICHWHMLPNSLYFRLHKAFNRSITIEKREVSAVKLTAAGKRDIRLWYCRWFPRPNSAF